MILPLARNFPILTMSGSLDGVTCLATWWASDVTPSSLLQFFAARSCEWVCRPWRRDKDLLRIYSRKNGNTCSDIVSLLSGNKCADFVRIRDKILDDGVINLSTAKRVITFSHKSIRVTRRVPRHRRFECWFSIRPH